MNVCGLGMFWSALDPKAEILTAVGDLCPHWEMMEQLEGVVLKVKRT